MNDRVKRGLVASCPRGAAGSGRTVARAAAYCVVSARIVPQVRSNLSQGNVRIGNSGGGLREAGYPNAPQSKMLGGKTVVLPPRF